MPCRAFGACLQISLLQGLCQFLGSPFAAHSLRLSDRSPQLITDLSLRRQEICDAKQTLLIVDRDLLSHQLLPESDVAESLVLVTGVASQPVFQ